MRCSARPAAARPRCSTSSRASSRRRTGKVLFDGADVTALPTEQRNIAQVFQFPVIYDTMTVDENLAFPLRNRGVPAEQIDARVREIAACSTSTGELNRVARGLTADVKQKISLGRGLVRADVNAIMFDEPLTVIDPHLKWQLRCELKALHREFGHDDDLCDARPDRGADLRRPGRGHARRRGRADRHAGGAVRAAGAHLRRPFHRLAGHERPAGRGRRATSRASAASTCRSPASIRTSPAKGTIEIGVRPEFVRVARARRHPGRSIRGRGRRPLQDRARRIQRRRARGARRRGRGRCPPTSRVRGRSGAHARLRRRRAGAEAEAHGQARHQSRLVPGAAGRRCWSPSTPSSR